MWRTERASKFLFWFILLLGLIDRAHLLHITIGFATDDLAVVWMAARDYANGVFHEPFFYGQNYGIMLEALLAAPFIRYGADPAIAVPVAMAFLAMVPYWSFALFEYHRSNTLAAALIAAIPLLLPVEHGLQFTNLNGLAMLALYPWAAGMKPSGWRSALIGAVLAAAAFVNMNTLVAAAAFGMYFLLRNVTQRKQWLWAACGALPVLLAWWWSMEYYAVRPEHMAHTIFDWRMVFHASLIPEALVRLDVHFAWLCPLWWPNGHLVLWLLAGVAVALFRSGDRPAAWAILSALLVIFLSFGFAKVHDGTSSLLFPLSRMFLAVPLLLGWSVAQLNLENCLRSYAVPILCLFTVGTFSLRYMQAVPVWNRTLNDPKGTPIYVQKVGDIRFACESLMRYAQETSADEVVVIRNPDVGQALFTTMGCPVCEPALPPTYMPHGDRRAWRIRQEAHVHRQRLLIVGGDPAIWAKARGGPFDVLTVRTAYPMLHTVIGAGLPVDSLILRLGFIVGP